MSTDYLQFILGLVDAESRPIFKSAIRAMAAGNLGEYDSKSFDVQLLVARKAYSVCLLQYIC